MVFHKIQKSIVAALITSMVVTSLPTTNYTRILEANAKTTNNSRVVLADNTKVSEDADGVFKVSMDETGYITADNEYAADVNTPFSWDNASMYFVITDRFFNGDKSNDHSYGRSTK